MESDKYSIQWRNHVQHLQKTLTDFKDSEILCDVTLVSDKAIFKAHQCILSACSAYFKKIFQHVPATQHPIMFLQYYTAQQIQCLIEFMYKGETSVPYSILSDFLELCESLQIQAFREETSNSQEPQLPSQFSNQVNEEVPIATQNKICLLSSVTINQSPNAGKRQDVESDLCKKTTCGSSSCSPSRPLNESLSSSPNESTHIDSSPNKTYHEDILESPPHSPESVAFSPNNNSDRAKSRYSESVLFVTQADSEIIEISQSPEISTNKKNGRDCEIVNMSREGLSLNYAVEDFNSDDESEIILRDRVQTSSPINNEYTEADLNDKAGPIQQGQKLTNEGKRENYNNTSGNRDEISETPDSSSAKRRRPTKNDSEEFRGSEIPNSQSIGESKRRVKSKEPNFSPRKPFNRELRSATRQESTRKKSRKLYSSLATDDKVYEKKLDTHNLEEPGTSTQRRRSVENQDRKLRPARTRKSSWSRNLRSYTR